MTASARPPRIDLAVLPVLDEVDGASLLRNDERDRERYSDSDLSARDLTGSVFTECEFSTPILDGTQLRGSRFVECRLTDSFAPSLLAARTSWRDVLVVNPRWGSAELFEADLTSVHVSGGKIDYLNLRTSKITDLLIEDCTITDLDLGGCRGTRIALRNCRIETLDLTRAVLADVDLRSTTLATVNGLDGLRGVTIDDYQLSLFAPLFASYLGVAVD
ncbi:pentapeptide repeat-containing protein [Lacisediminihabitans sp. FW035]